MAPDSRPDLAAYEDVVRMSRAQLIAQLRELLGVRLVAYLAKVRDTRVVRQWLDDADSGIGDVDIERLRLAYRAARMISELDSTAVAQVWFQGRNPALDDRPPALLMREGKFPDAGTAVLAAACEFVAHR